MSNNPKLLVIADQLEEIGRIDLATVLRNQTKEYIKKYIPLRINELSGIVASLVPRGDWREASTVILFQIGGKPLNNEYVIYKIYRLEDNNIEIVLKKEDREDYIHLYKPVHDVTAFW